MGSAHLRPSLSFPEQPGSHGRGACDVHYVNDLAGFVSPACSPHILGIVSYDATDLGHLPLACPRITVPLRPAGAGGPIFEVWTSAAPVTCIRTGPVVGAFSNELAFGVLTIQEAGNAPLERAAEDAYLRIFDFLDQTGFHEPVRFWNYLTAITTDERGLERYRRFNTGRQHAFLARLRQNVPPVASCVGGERGASVIYFLAARTAAAAIENPRQISAYAYPPLYGPTSPSFSRASLHGPVGARHFFISGTASIVGHETRHAGDLNAQLAETMANLQTLIGLAGYSGQQQGWAVKAYLRDPSCQDAVDAALVSLFGAQSQRLHLHADICRTDLLVEIEACHLQGG